MAAELPRPGVEVIQEFRSVSPTVVTPTLVPSVVGVAREVVEVTELDAAGNTVLNGDALVLLPAFFDASAASGSPAVYSGLDGLILAFSVNNAPVVQVTFDDPTASGLTPATVVSQVNDRLDTLNVSSVRAETLGDDQWRLRTVGLGSFQQIVIDSTTDPAVLTAFGIGVGKTYAGIDNYNQYEVNIPPTNFPDPRGNLSELVIENDTIRVFVNVGGTTLTEFLRDESFLRNGNIDDPAQLVGSVDLTTLTYPGDVQGDDLDLIINGTTVSHTIASNPADANALVSELEANFPGANFSLQTGTNFIVIETELTGGESSLEADAGALLTDLGIVASTSDTGESINAVDDGNGDVVTPLLDFPGEDFTASGTAAVLTGSAPVSLPLTAGTTLIISDGQQPQTIVFTAAAVLGDVISEINAVVGTAAGGKLTAADAGGGELELTHSETGEQSFIHIIGGTALADLDPGGTPTIVAGATVNGNPHPPQAGDELYIDGSFFATITEVAPGGAVDQLKIDQQIAISLDVGASFYIQAKNLSFPSAADRPDPDLIVTTTGDVILKHSFLRDTGGSRSDVLAPIYLSYNAVRQDVTALAANPGLLRFDDTATLETSLDPVSTDNPLALGLFFALINAPGAQVTGLGVDEISADAPFGTVDGFTRAAEFLESFEVYAIALLTHNQTVAEVFNTHVNFMSEPENKGERIVLWNPEVPTKALDTLVASGTDGDKLTATTFDTKVASLAAFVQAAGVSPVGTIPVSEGLFLDLAADDENYSIESISGSVVTIRTTFAAGENDDGFYSTTDLSSLTLISADFAVRVRGADLVLPTGQQDKQAVAENLALLGQTFQNRRFWMTFPDQCAATLNGLEQLINGFYMNAAIVGMIGQQPPQQSFTNFPMTGFTRVIGSNGVFSEQQLNIMAAGGVYIIIQDGQGAPLTARFALTTDLTSIETRTDSITKVVDFTAKFLRRSLQTFIGRFNITQSFLDSLGSVIQGVLNFLVESGVLIGGTLNNLIQDEDEPDTVLVDITLDVPFPANFIRVTLVV